MHRKLEQPHQLAFLDWVLIIVGISSKIIKTEKGIRSLDHISPPLNHIQLFWVHQSCYIIHCTINQGKEKTNRNLQWTRIWKYMHAREGNHSHMSKYQVWRSRVAQEAMYNQPKGWHVECINIRASENIWYTNARGMWGAWTCEHRKWSSLSDDKWIHRYASMWPHKVCPMRWHVKCIGMWEVFVRKWH